LEKASKRKLMKRWEHPWIRWLIPLFFKPRRHLSACGHAQAGKGHEENFYVRRVKRRT